MSIQVVTKYSHTPDSKTIKFHSNAKFRLPSIRQSHLEDQLINQLNIRHLDQASLKRQMQQQLSGSIEKLKNNVQKLLNFQHRAEMLQNEWEEHKKDKALKINQKIQKSNQKRANFIQNIKKKGEWEKKKRQSILRNKAQEQAQLYNNSLTRINEWRKSIEVTVEKRNKNIQQRIQILKQSHRRKSEHAKPNPSHLPDTIPHILETIIANPEAQINQMSTTNKNNTFFQTKGGSKTKLIDTQTKVRFNYQKIMEETVSNRIDKVLRKTEQIAMARKQKQQRYINNLTQIKKKQNYIKQLHEKNKQKLAEETSKRHQQILQRSMRSVHSTKSIASNRSSRSNKSHTEDPYFSSIRKSLAAKCNEPSFHGPIKDKLHSLTLEYYQKLKNNEIIQN